MAFPTQNTTDPSAAGSLLVSNAIVAGITNAATLPPLALLQECVANLLVDAPAGLVLTALTGAIATTGAISSTSSIKSSSVSAGVGYATGAGGIVTQATNKQTAVVLSKMSGQIVTSTEALLPGVETTFTVTNAGVVATDVIAASIGAGGTSGSYALQVGAVAAGSFDLTLSNLSAVSLTQAVTINIAVLRAVNA